MNRTWIIQILFTLLIDAIIFVILFQQQSSLLLIDYFPVISPLSFPSKAVQAALLPKPAIPLALSPTTYYCTVAPTKIIFSNFLASGKLLNPSSSLAYNTAREHFTISFNVLLSIVIAVLCSTVH